MLTSSPCPGGGPSQELEPGEAVEEEDEVAGAWARAQGAMGPQGPQGCGGHGWGAVLGPPLQTLCSTGHSHVMQRVLSTMQFLWVLGQASVDGLTSWLLAFTRYHRNMSDVLRAERYLLTQQLLQVSPALCPASGPRM